LAGFVTVVESLIRPAPVTPKNFNQCFNKIFLATNACLRILKVLFNFYRHLINFSQLN
jgi:hypothetical protein